MLGNGSSDAAGPGGPTGADLPRRALDAAGIGAFEWDLATGQVFWSSCAREITKVPLETIDDFFEVVHPDDRATLRSGIEAAQHGHQSQQFEVRLSRAEDTLAWVDLRAAVERDDDGEPRTVVGTMFDITDRKDVEAAREEHFRDEQTSRAEAEASTARLQFLVTSGREIRAVLDPMVVGRTAAGLLVPPLADWAVILDAEGEQVTALATTTGTPDAAAAQEFRLDEPLEVIEKAVGTGDPQLANGPAELRLVRGGTDHETLEASSLAALPLTLGANRMGVLLAGHSRTGRPYQTPDLELLTQFAESLTATLVKATLFQERSAIARVLQQSLLPTTLPRIPGVEVAAQYLPIGEGLIVGGDFYDVFRVSDKTYAFAIGDVSGKGTEAAAVTAMVRHSIRAFAEVHDDPADLVRALNDALRIHSPSPRFSTVVFGFLDVGDEVGVRVAVAGHPLPLLATSDGAVEVLGTPGTLLGVFPEVEVVTDRRPLAPGDTLVLYTDGVVESRREGVAFGEPRLRRLLESVAGGDAAAVADCIPDAIAEYQDDPSDDLAVLVVQRRPAPSGS